VSSSSSEPSSAQPASTSCRRREIMAIGTAAVVASVTAMITDTGAAEAAPRDDGAAVAQRSGSRQVWELSAAAPSSSSSERADLVSPTVLPQLSASERQVRTIDLLVQLPPCSHSACRRRAACVSTTCSLAVFGALVADRRLPTIAENPLEANPTRRSWSTTSAYSGRTASRGTSRSLSGKVSQSR